MSILRRFLFSLVLLLLPHLTFFPSSRALSRYLSLSHCLCLCLTLPPLPSSHHPHSQSIQIHTDIKSRCSIGMHWGTFVLTAEVSLASFVFFLFPSLCSSPFFTTPFPPLPFTIASSSSQIHISLRPTIPACVGAEREDKKGSRWDRLYDNESW